MPLPILTALTKALPYITTAWSLYAQSKNKPKKEDYVPSGGMYQRWINYLKGQTTESRVYHQRMRPALRQIGAQTRRGQRGVDVFAARHKPGAGVEAQMRMGINQQALEALGLAGEKASMAQERVNVRTGEQLLRIGMREEAALQRYQRDKQRFTQRMFTSTVSAGLNLANVAVQQHIADAKIAAAAAKDATEAAEAINKAYENAKAVGDFVGTLDQFKEGMDIADYKDPTAMGKHLGYIKAQQEKDIKFQKDVELEEMKRQSADELIRYKQYADEHPEDALAFLRESKYFEKTMITKDYIKAGEYAAGRSTQLYPFENEFTEAVIRNNFKDMKNISDKIYESKATNKVKLSVHRTVQAAKAERIADLERELREAEKADAKALKLEIKGLKFDADKDTLSLLLGVESELHPNYREGENEQGKLYSVVGKDSIKRLQTTIKGISFNKKTGAGIGKSVALGMKKDIIRWAKSIEFDDQRITIMFGNMSELTANIPKLNEYINTSTTSEFDSRALSLIKQYLGRIDALYKQIPFDDTLDLVAQTKVP